MPVRRPAHPTAPAYPSIADLHGVRRTALTAAVLAALGGSTLSVGGCQSEQPLPGQPSGPHAHLAGAMPQPEPPEPAHPQAALAGEMELVLPPEEPPAEPLAPLMGISSPVEHPVPCITPLDQPTDPSTPLEEVYPPGVLRGRIAATPLRGLDGDMVVVEPPMPNGDG